MFDNMTTIGNIAEVFDGPHATPKKIESGAYYLSISSLEKGRLDLSKSACLSESDFKKWTKRVTPKEGDILFSYETRLGEVALMPKNVKACLGRRMGLLRIKDSKVIPKYLLYAYLSPYFQLTILSNTIKGATVDRIALSELPNFEIRIPEQDEQKKVAGLLQALDEKIALNNRINTELEAMAKTLYDYWFVQFDFPISEAQANALGKPELKGKPYKSSGGKMVFNEALKREIPEGWGARKIKEIAKTGSGGTPLKSREEFYANGDIPWINSGEVNHPFIISAKKFITEEGLNNSSAKVFPKGTILMAMYGATAGKVSLMDLEACTNQAICGINPHDDHFKTFIKFGLEDMYKYLINLSTGSARDNLSQDKIKELFLVVPSDNYFVKEFHSKTFHSMNSILINLKQNQQLTQLRDWLLPMLMNGQVTVK